jgi:DNA-binding response OmpR family regulator
MGGASAIACRLLKLLDVDDDVELQELLKIRFRVLGYDASAPSNPQNAEEMSETIDPQVVVFGV